MDAVREQLGLNGADVDFRKRWLGWNEKHTEAMKELEPLAKENSAAVVKKFYDHSFSFPEFARVVERNGSNRERLTAAQTGYFMDLFSGRYDDEHVNKRLGVGMGHYHLGVGPKMFIGSYAQFFEAWVPVLIKQYRRKPEQLDTAIQAFLKLVCFDMAVILNAYVLGYINSMQEQATKVKAEADKSMEGAKAILQSLQQVADAMAQVAKGANEQANTAQGASESTTKLSESAKSISAAAGDQSKAITDVNNMIQQLSKAIEEIKGNVETGAKNSQTASENSKKGATVVKQTIDGMERIRSRVDTGANLINELGAKSEEIGKIVGAIEEIADQTNLLALNAAIEAARAGDQGRGFAVVADEVRNLAERAANATKEIAALIESVRGGVVKSVEAMQTGSKEVATGADLAKQAGDALGDILNAVDATNGKVSEIGTSSKEMVSITLKVVDAVNTVAAAAQQNSASSEEMERLSRDVSNAVESFASVSEENSAASEEVSASIDTAKGQATQISSGAEAVVSSVGSLQKELETLGKLT